MSKKEIEMWDVIVKFRTRKDAVGSKMEAKKRTDEAICTADFPIEDLEITVR